MAGHGTIGDYQNGNVGGFVKPSAHKRREQRVKWTAENDRKLLIYTNGQNPTPKAIEVRISKLRMETEQRVMQDGLPGIHTALNVLPGTEMDLGSDDDSPSTIVNPSPLASQDDDVDYSPKPAKAKKKKQARSAAPTSTNSTNLDTPEDLNAAQNLFLMAKAEREGLRK
ncbi:hypothetical protein LTR08_006058 [Meristemomyces frigidus]|nr:hypothetical protein LTR08_006058 [Meristemomyces frigidus]